MNIELFFTDNRLEAQAVRDALLDAGVFAVAQYSTKGGYVIGGYVIVGTVASVDYAREQVAIAVENRKFIPTKNLCDRTRKAINKNLDRYERENAKVER